MTWQIPEKDWKKLRGFKDEMLKLACERIFGKISELITQRQGHEHDTYLKLWRLIEKEDKAIADMFNNLSRSNAVFKLAYMKHHRVLSDEKFEKFSDEIKERVNFLNGDAH